MKKIITIITSIIIVLSMINTTNADKLESKLYKATILSRIKISKDFKDGDLYNKKIYQIFIKYRYNKDVTTLNKLKILLKEKIILLNNKAILSGSERRKLNLYNNMYYRTILLLDYNLK